MDPSFNNCTYYQFYFNSTSAHNYHHTNNISQNNCFNYK